MHSEKPAILGPSNFENPLVDPDVGLAAAIGFIDKPASAFGSIDDSSRPAILGPLLFTDPIAGPDGTVASAFGPVEPKEQIGETDTEAHIREQVWGGENCIPPEPSAIAEEITVLRGVIGGTEPDERPNRRILNYFYQLTRGYAKAGGSPSLLYLEQDADHADRVLAQSKDPSSYRDTQALRGFGALHAPLDPEQKAEMIETTILPNILRGFNELHSFVGRIVNFSRFLPNDISDHDPMLDANLIPVLQAYGEHLQEFDNEQLAQWMKSYREPGHGLERFTRLFVKIAGIEVSEKRVVADDSSIMQLAATPLINYFTGNEKEVFDFDRLRSFVGHCRSQARAEHPKDYRASSYWEVAEDATYLVCTAHNKVLKERQQTLQDVLEKRIGRVVSAGLDPKADAMMFAHSLNGDVQVIA